MFIASNSSVKKLFLEGDMIACDSSAFAMNWRKLHEQKLGAAAKALVTVGHREQQWAQQAAYAKQYYQSQKCGLCAVNAKL